ncbi:MAG: hypothetical protein U5L00_14640 [Desulfovermiculus sp.]|nr:hypothetical protein [Desulfovermiculus sp.]
MKIRHMLLIGLLLGAVFILDAYRPGPGPEIEEKCLTCHDQVSDPDPSHPVSALGCASCHLGNAHSLDQERAHAGMVQNPGDLRAVDQTCGQTECHPDIVPRVRASIMATNKGILNTLYYHWETDEQLAAAPRAVSGMLQDADRLSLAEDQFAKMCASCHLWKVREGEGEIGLRGGGCSACHVVEKGQTGDDPTLSSFTHSRLSVKIPEDNCLRCHNRSARQGLSYQGKFESEGYGTPYVRGAPGTRRLSGGRFYLEGPADVHFEKGLTCIDCHTHWELMGDGREHEYMEEQTEISCAMCHDPTFESVRSGDELSEALVGLNRSVPQLEGANIVYSPKGAPLYHLRSTDRGAVLFRKLDGKPVPIKSTELSQPHHTLPGHERLSCQACHSKIMPQCYGCHLEYRRDRFQMDKLSGQETRGQWKEGRSYMRLIKPTLGVDGGEIRPFAPCQVMVSVFDRQGRHQSQASKAIPAMTTFDPHTTGKASRTCIDCHLDPKTIGLGQGHLYTGQGHITIQPLYDSQKSKFGLQVPPEAFVSLDGSQLQTTSRPDRRPFTREELQTVFRPGPCLTCHHGYADPVYVDFENSLRRIKTGKAPDCPVNMEDTPVQRTR